MSQSQLAEEAQMATGCRRPLVPVPAKTVRILLADDHEIVRQGLRSLLESRQGWSVIGEASNGTEAVEKAIELVPDVVVLDIGMPELNGLEAIRRIRDALRQTEVLVLSVHDAEHVVRRALASGARAYLAKSDAGRDLVAAVEAALRHKTFLSPKISQSLGSASGDGETSLAHLTTREREAAQLLAEGLGNKEIASRLDISVKTVETHRTNIMRKIGAHSLADIVRYAIRNGLAEP
ncbi:MAG TPA: response regulator transcription factor [Terriglobia bacterium]|nr:response regulator transcription factor [Terriglobia bacterium]